MRTAYLNTEVTEHPEYFGKLYWLFLLKKLYFLRVGSN